MWRESMTSGEVDLDGTIGCYWKRGEERVWEAAAEAYGSSCITPFYDVNEK